MKCTRWRSIWRSSRKVRKYRSIAASFECASAGKREAKGSQMQNAKKKEDAEECTHVDGLKALYTARWFLPGKHLSAQPRIMM